MPTEVKLSGKTLEFVNVLASILAQATLRSPTAEKALIGKEFARVFEILSKRLAEIYAKAPVKLRQDLEKASLAVIKLITPPPPPTCCVGYPDATSLEDCEHNGGIWACFANPIKEPLTP